MDELPSPFFLKGIGKSGNTTKEYPHRDDYYIFACITKGTATATIDFDDMTLSAGDAVIISPMQVHSPANVDPETEGWLLAITSEYLSEQNATMAEKYALHPKPIHLKASTIHELSQLTEILSQHSDDQIIAKAITSVIINLIMAYIQTDIAQSANRYMTIALRLKNLLSANIDKEKSPAYYASLLNISEGYLNESIKAVTGLSVSRFIRNQVIIKAKRLIVYTSMPPQEIGYRLGYDDYTYFSAIFKKETGHSPTSYRKSHH